MGLGLAVRSPWGSGKMRRPGEAKTAILFSVGLGEGQLGPSPPDPLRPLGSSLHSWPAGQVQFHGNLRS